KDASGKEVGRDKTDANGKLVFPNLIVGQTYTVTEVVQDGWVCENNNQTITIQEGTNQLTYVNKRLDLKLIKLSSDGYTSGISFQIFAGDGQHFHGTVWQTVTTGIDGTFVIEGIPAGVYWFREIVPDGYINQQDQRVVVTERNTYDNPTVVTFTNQQLSALKIVKQSLDGNVEGITFNVYKGFYTEKIELPPYATVTTDAEGTILLGALEPDTYYIKEIVPEGYEPQAVQSVVVASENTPDNPAIVTFVNVPRPSLKIVKESPDGNVEGVSFNIYNGVYNYINGQIMQTVTTTEDGTIQIYNLSSSSTYYIKENVPEGYLPQKVQTIRLNSDNTPSNPAIVTFTNVPIRGCISVNKINTSGVALEGATFLLEYSTDNGATWDAVKPATEDENGVGTCSTIEEDGTLTTGEDGQAVFDGLIVYGVTYRLTETSAPPGYQLLADPVFTGEIVADDNGIYEIYRTVVNVPTLQMPPTGGDGSVRLICAIATVVASASLLGLGLVCKRRKSPESNG
ncbi:MAG: collagen binding domain-containing protein, partial [Faecousia sp.]